MKKSFLLAALLSLCLVSCGDKQSSSNSSQTSSNLNSSINSSNKQSSNISSETTIPSNPGNYYDGVINLQGEELYKGLHDLMSNYTFIRYEDLGEHYVKTDSVKENNTYKMVDFYTHKLMTIPSDHKFGGAYNREHVWPRYHFTGANHNSSNAKAMKPNSDLHHVRPDFYELNNKRSNNKYGNVSHGDNQAGIYQAYDKGSFDTKCYLSGNVFEPNDISKGDCARICLYVAVTHNFNIRDVFTGNDETIKKTLLEWNELDPVDNIEIKRNEETFKIQKNRNVFIDHNELFDDVVNTIL